MGKILITLMLLFVMCGAPSIVMASDVVGVEILNFGIYKADVIKKEDAAGSAAGYKNIVQNVALIEQTTNIPARVGTRFGFAYVIKGSPVGSTIDLTYKYLHPRMNNPKTNQAFTSQEIVSKNREIGKAATLTYTFDYEWEAVAGEWTVQIFYAGKKLAEKTFYIYKP